MEKVKICMKIYIKKSLKTEKLKKIFEKLKIKGGFHIVCTMSLSQIPTPFYSPSTQINFFINDPSHISIYRDFNQIFNLPPIMKPTYNFPNPLTQKYLIIN